MKIYKNFSINMLKIVMKNTSKLHKKITLYHNIKYTTVNYLLKQDEY